MAQLNLHTFFGNTNDQREPAGLREVLRNAAAGREYGIYRPNGLVGAWYAWVATKATHEEIAEALFWANVYMGKIHTWAAIPVTDSTDYVVHRGPCMYDSEEMWEELDDIAYAAEVGVDVSIGRNRDRRARLCEAVRRAGDR